MPEKLVRQESAVQFFREQLVKAMEHQRISTSAFTEYYLVNLLTASASLTLFLVSWRLVIIAVLVVRNPRGFSVAAR